MKITIRKSSRWLSALHHSGNRRYGKLAGGVVGLAGTLLFATQLFASTIVNINTATALTIAESLDGIGPVKAQAIVDYRNKNGLFRDASDIMKVAGIGEATYALLKSYLTIGSSTDKAGRSDNKTSSVSPKTTVPATTQAAASHQQ